MSMNSVSFTGAPGVKIYNNTTKDRDSRIVINPDQISYMQKDNSGKVRLYLADGASPYFDIRGNFTEEECAEKLMKAQAESKKTGKVIDLSA